MYPLETHTHKHTHIVYTHSHTNTHGMVATKISISVAQTNAMPEVVKGSNYQTYGECMCQNPLEPLSISNIYRYSRDACTSSIYNQGNNSSYFIHGHSSLLHMQRIVHSHRFSLILADRQLKQFHITCNLNVDYLGFCLFVILFLLFRLFRSNLSFVVAPFVCKLCVCCLL